MIFDLQTYCTRHSTWTVIHLALSNNSTFSIVSFDAWLNHVFSPRTTVKIGCEHFVTYRSIFTFIQRKVNNALICTKYVRHALNVIQNCYWWVLHFLLSPVLSPLRYVFPENSRRNNRLFGAFISVYLRYPYTCFLTRPLCNNKGKAYLLCKVCT